MPLSRQKFREIVFQMLYSMDMGKPEESEIIELLMKELSINRSEAQSAKARVDKVLEKKAEIDQHITKISLSYEFERIHSVERNVLRLGVYELLFDSDIPPKVALAEAMRLASKFGTVESTSFVNAILDNLYKTSIGEQPDSNQIAQAAELLKRAEKAASEKTMDEET